MSAATRPFAGLRSGPLLGLRLLLGLGLFAASGPALAQVSQSDADGGLELRVRSAWPTGVHRGYAPITVEVENAGDVGVVVDLSLENDTYGSSARIQSRVVVAGGDVVATELLMPAFTDGVYWRAEARSSLADRCSLRWNGFGGAPSQRLAHVLVVSGAGGDSPAEWAEALKTGEVQPEARVRFGAGGPVATTAQAGPNVGIAHASFDALPQRWEAYSSLDAVIVDLAEGPPPEGVLAPLLAWTRAGGTLVLWGPGARELASTHPALAPWAEPRFALGRRIAEAELRFFWGRVLAVEHEPLLGPGRATPGLRELVHEDPPWVPSPFTAPPELPGLAALGLDELPFRTLVLLLVGFAVLVGPVNFAVVRRLGRPPLALLTIPVLSLAVCAVLLGYALLVQGVDVKARLDTFALLDQRLHRVAAAEERLFFAGLAPGSGLTPAAGSACFPAPPRLDRRRADGTEYAIEAEGGLRLSDAYLPTRTLTSQVVLADRAARGRLAFRAQGDGLAVDNALGAAVEDLRLRDARGEWWRLEAPLPEGSTGTLVPEAIDPAEQWMTEFTGGRRVLGSADRLPHAAFAARLSGSPWRDDLGVELEEVHAAHRVVGVLDPAEVGGS